MLKNPLKALLDALINHFTKERLETLILQNDEKLLTFMLEDKNANDYKNAFFKTIANSLVFNEKALLECLEIKELENSFTRFENKIGLYSQGRPIKSSELVVLNFPFKDNVLLGNAKDNNTKSKECFYHEVLHKKEIDTLLHKKALCRFEMHGEGDLESALKDKNTNYLIKGNNLIALHSLKKKFAKQVKCIYIDPPYNTGNDSFNYNDNFNHSSWLVFMKNRLEVAREFLSDDGVIFVQCDDNEQAYLKVLMDEIFLRENFVGCISWKQFHSVKNDAANFSKNIEYILCYCKNFSKNLISNEPFDKSNLYKLKDENGFYKLDPVWAKSGNNFSPYTFLNGKTWSPPSGTFWRYSIGTLKDMEQNNRIVFNGKNPMAKRYLSEVAEGRKSATFWDGSEVGYNLNGDAEIKQLFNGNKVFNNPKPEALISRILEISTQENDLVLDFFAGSGTTCAVAHKMKRRYIGIEQMDYIETITKERLKKVIEGDQGGISKKCGFKGGGSFVYAELKEVNLEIKKQILNANSKSECLKIFDNLSERFLKRADGKMDEIDSEEFHNLDLNEQKRKCCDLLDSNEDYLNLGDIDEDAWGIDEITKKYNEIFYS
ncbi:site-specific DNA-methyltransferase [Helicobacter pylori]|uniref:site-specific DNA-methyltransferase n=1 Tax=Helicobacter pylori TaxID=210 RepID=UPI00287B6608|nr:site-specific DNA-methyltransferase [Helicobacter pylori]WNE32436.1 site-specific DNA-methyltransferase [Helicobacter pylori]WNE33863.1 site-specific DNA-methyltransferase [Helicobacter pylori]WNE35290.1 site-specific DNA-methyltransferase [Helicobacter pylori]WNE36716.1 site-specific DNA-methyltransferase [Helicobacter pylori]WNE38144.1 site-specific DNA-methyltransferase [Helicobacter pylori]